MITRLTVVDYIVNVINIPVYGVQTFFDFFEQLSTRVKILDNNYNQFCKINKYQALKELRETQGILIFFLTQGDSEQF